jgi:dienelactone hydrolase
MPWRRDCGTLKLGPASGRRFIILVAPLLCLIGLGVSGFAGAEKAPFYSDKQDLLYYLDGHGERHAIRTTGEWKKRRRDIVTNMELVMGPLPRIDHKLPLRIEVLREGHTEKYTWQRITYQAEPGDRGYAYLYIPNGLKPDHRAPAIVSLHGTTYPHYIPQSEPTATHVSNDTGDAQYAEELAERGYVVIAPDYLFLGSEYKTDPYAMGYASGTMNGVVNHIRSVDVLVSRPEVDPKRLGDVGLSLGGHNAMFLAIFDPRIRVIVTSCGFTSFEKYYGGNLERWATKYYMPRITSAYGNRPDRMPFDFTEVLGALAPRPVFINATLGDPNFDVSGVKDCVTAATPVYQLFRADDRLVAIYPEGGHSFAPPSRQAAYAFLDKGLRHQTN